MNCNTSSASWGIIFIFVKLSVLDNLTLTTNNFHERPDFRPETKYESRGMRLGHAVWDILATKG